MVEDIMPEDIIESDIIEELIMPEVIMPEDIIEESVIIEELIIVVVGIIIVEVIIIEDESAATRPARRLTMTVVYCMFAVLKRVVEVTFYEIMNEWIVKRMLLILKMMLVSGMVQSMSREPTGSLYHSMAPYLVLSSSHLPVSTRSTESGYIGYML